MVVFVNISVVKLGTCIIIMQLFTLQLSNTSIAINSHFIQHLVVENGINRAPYCYCYCLTSDYPQQSCVILYTFRTQKSQCTKMSLFTNFQHSTIRLMIVSCFFFNVDFNTIFTNKFHEQPEQIFIVLLGFLKFCSTSMHYYVIFICAWAQCDRNLGE